MSRLSAAAAEILHALHSAGIRAAIDPRDLDLPAVWITPETISAPTLSGDPLSITWAAYAIAPDTGDPTDTLSRLVDDLTALFPGLTFRSAGIVVANQSPDPLPSLQFQIETETTA